MAKSKLELESDFNRHDSTMELARDAQRRGDYRGAVVTAVSAWSFIDGMMQYAKKYHDMPMFSSVDSIDLVLKLAPLLLDFESLTSLAALLKAVRRIEKNTTVNLAEELVRAQSRMESAYRLFDHLENTREARQDELRRALGGEQDEWRSVCEYWEKMGIVSRIKDGGSYRVSLTTQMSVEVRAKCPSCGVVGKVTKSRLLDEIKCPKCHRVSHFVLVGAQATASEA